MDIAKFLKLRKEYVASDFSKLSIALVLSTMMGREPSRIPTGMEDNSGPLGYIALRPTRYPFGEIRAGEVIQVCSESERYILTSYPSVMLHTFEFYSSVDHYEVWLPLCSEWELLKALECWREKNPDESPTLVEA